MSSQPIVPTTAKQWEVKAQALGVESLAIHDHQVPSASNVSESQFLMLRAFWTESENRQSFEKRRLTKGWLDDVAIRAAEKHLDQAQHTSWQSYLRSFGHRDCHALQFQGTFALARLYQELSTRGRGETTQPKVYFSPNFTTRSHTRAALELTPTKKSVPPADSGESMGKLGDRYLSSAMSSMSLGGSGTDSPYATPLWMPNSGMNPGDDYEYGDFEAVEDEQIVNTALVIFLNALTIHCRHPTPPGSWSLYRKPFVVKHKVRGKVFEARVDGLFRLNDAKETRVIIEVKPVMRGVDMKDEKNRKNWDKIRMQETAQMAAWIAAEPPQTANPPAQKQLDFSSNAKAKVIAADAQKHGSQSQSVPVDDRKHRRLLVSQDRHEIWLTVGTFNDAYVHYITGEDLTTTGHFLEMREFGPFNVSEQSHMRRLGVIMLAVSLQGGLH